MTHHQGHEKDEKKARTGTSATGSNAGPDRRSLNEDALSGTTSGVPPKHAPDEGPRMQKPHKGSRFDPDS